MADAIAEIGELDPSRCRASAARYAAHDGIAAQYEAMYRELASQVPSEERIAGDLKVQRGDPAHAEQVR